jgi:hypothetical protein
MTEKETRKKEREGNKEKENDYNRKRNRHIMNVVTNILETK